jgi:hypothetical protein
MLPDIRLYTVPHSASRPKVLLGISMCTADYAQVSQKQEGKILPVFKPYEGMKWSSLQACTMPTVRNHSRPTDHFVAKENRNPTTVKAKLFSFQEAYLYSYINFSFYSCLPHFLFSRPSSFTSATHPGSCVTPHYTKLTTLLLKLKLNSVALVRERTIPTERPPLVVEVSVNFYG